MRAVRTMKLSESLRDIDKSGVVTSSQAGVHPQLERHVLRHLGEPWLQPFHHPSTDAYHHLISDGGLSEDKSIILDSGCGTGKSTQRLAELYPRHIVIGVDQSHVRLAKSGVSSGFSRNGNCILLRAELSTFWRLLLIDGHTPERHFLFYPNPWPKPGHLKRRWHGHPVFPHLLSLGGEIELRCNWEIYALEFAQAVNLATGADIRRKTFHPKNAVSPFEQKYMLRDQSLFSVLVPAQITQAFGLSRLVSQAG